VVNVTFRLLYPQEKPRYPLNRMLGGLQRPSGLSGKKPLAPSGNTVEPRGVHHTDSATSGHPVLAKTIQHLFMLRSSAGTGLDLQMFLVTVSYLLLTQLLTYLFKGLLIYLLTHSLTPWSRVFLEKLTGSQLVKKFTAFYGRRRFITAFTSACHLSLS
jgi:hypothetical protein